MTENPEVISKKKPKKKTKKQSKTSTKTTVNQRSSLNSTSNNENQDLATYTTNQIEKSIYKNEISLSSLQANLLANTLLETKFENDDLASFSRNKEENAIETSEDNIHLNADENAQCDNNRKEAVVLVEKRKNSLAYDDEKSHIEKSERKQILKSLDMDISKEEPFILEKKLNRTESKSDTDKFYQIVDNFIGAKSVAQEADTQLQMTLNASPSSSSSSSSSKEDNDIESEMVLKKSDVDKFSKIVESFIESKPLNLDYIGK
jgi:hypothetical protein